MGSEEEAVDGRGPLLADGLWAVARFGSDDEAQDGWGPLPADGSDVVAGGGAVERVAGRLARS